MTPAQSVTYPLEGNHYDEARFFMYDKAGRAVWGEARVRREKNPDVLVLELRQADTVDWKPVLKMTAHDGKMLFAAFGLEGGRNT